MAQTTMVKIMKFRSFELDFRNLMVNAHDDVKSFCEVRFKITETFFSKIEILCIKMMFEWACPACPHFELQCQATCCACEPGFLMGNPEGCAQVKFVATQLNSHSKFEFFCPNWKQF